MYRRKPITVTKKKLETTHETTPPQLFIIFCLGLAVIGCNTPASPKDSSKPITPKPVATTTQEFKKKQPDIDSQLNVNIVVEAESNTGYICELPLESGTLNCYKKSILYKELKKLEQAVPVTNDPPF